MLQAVINYTSKLQATFGLYTDILLKTKKKCLLGLQILLLDYS